MRTGTKAFMESLIDYAGLYPPAALPMEAAMRNYCRYQRDRDGWMLGGFVVPVARLGELLPFKPLFAADRPLRLTVIAARSRSAEDCLPQLRENLARIAVFRRRYAEAAAVAALELPLPPPPFPPGLFRALEETAAGAGLRLFCEPAQPLDACWEAAMLEALDAMAAAGGSARGGPGLGAKLRTGGVTAAAIPSPGQVALVLEACRDRSLPLKCTAGLHHPVRMHREEVNARMHGYLNVFFAGTLAYARRLGRPDIEAILEDEDPASFGFADVGLRWRDRIASASDIRACRGRGLVAFGSCSFDEPVGELRALGLLEQRS
ncbi:hypothetical protein I8J29_01495 [Paenibacillus sp. MWE-103]|uniref:Uncharacterized protein n=1 Tax=Paenibacillus artemisiicola TaxID=1172618 RepID=A0ABS3W3G8_9BACL|nr:hypothetical protein [Paenibacillus artemisiicola]MBO7742851.1 hypothetical protein [Paenibacillus artemisiicola]